MRYRSLFIGSLVAILAFALTACTNNVSNWFVGNAVSAWFMATGPIVDADAMARQANATAMDEAFFESIPVNRQDDGGFVLGDPEAPITIVVFIDWYCPACQQYKLTMDRIIQDYVVTGKARLELRTLTTAGANQTPNTSQVSAILECIETLKPGSYFYANEIAFQTVMRGARSSEIASSLAERTGVDLAELELCTQDPSDQVLTDQNLAQSSGVASTPSVLYRLNGGDLEYVVDRSYEGLAALINASE
jgi:protein-disulfide isomerase